MRISTIWLTALLVVFVAGCGGGGGVDGGGPPAPALDATPPTVSSTNPGNATAGAAINQKLTANFSEAVASASCTTATFTLAQGTTPVAGAVSCVGSTAVFAPTTNLTASLPYTATLTTGFKDLAGNALAANRIWTFVAGAEAAAGPHAGAGPAPVSLGTTAGFAILSKTGITDSGSHSSVITGNIGASPITAAAIGVFCSEITGTGKIYGVDAAYVGSGTTTCFAGNPPKANKTLVDDAEFDMELAYNDAAGRTVPAPTIALGAGDISNLTLAPGIYKWTTGVNIDTRGVTLAGTVASGANDVWIFQIAGNLTVANTAVVTLSNGALPKNVFWQVAGQATLGTTSAFKGTILSKTQIVVQTGATMLGSALAQTQVTLDASTVTAQ